MELLGLFWILLFIGTPCVIGAWLGKRYGQTSYRNKRKRQIETAVAQDVYDADLYDEVIYELAARRARRR
ncbi:hypothetical protein [Streptomyces scabiei]|uniref:hypothetical protein n=1 Tax=Streptomyces scabiei TaxID=1930 RepID=UPI0007658C4B|nr:hypothetical protein [Streptomyces scabiei]